MVDVGSGSATIFKFTNVGDNVEGVIASVTEEDQPEGFKDGKPFGTKLHSRTGEPEKQWVITLERDDDEDARVYASKWRMRKAIGDAVRKTGNRQLENGAFLSVTRIADVDVENARFPANAFEAVYSPPSDEDRAKDAWGSDATQASNAPF